VTDVVVVSLEYYRAVVSILRVPQENLSWYLVLNIFRINKCYYVLTIWRFCVPKLIDIEPGLFELFENVLGVRFVWRHSTAASSKLIFIVHNLGKKTAVSGAQGH